MRTPQARHDRIIFNYCTLLPSNAYMPTIGRWGSVNVSVFMCIYELVLVLVELFHAFSFTFANHGLIERERTGDAMLKFLT